MTWFSWGARPPAARNLAVHFPNGSRSYDVTRRAVRFWGHDRSMECPFFVTTNALKYLHPELEYDAKQILRAFDTSRDRIQAAAARVYARGRKGSYDVDVVDL